MTTGAMNEPKSGVSKEEIIGWGGSEVFNKALALCNSGDVKDVTYDDDTLVIAGKIEQPSGWSMPVSLKLLAGGRIKSMCPCLTNQRDGKICPHVVALGIARMVMEMDLPEEPPRHEERPAEPAPTQEFIEVPIKPRITARVIGSNASLAVELFATYGDVSFSACSVQPSRKVWLVDEDDPLVRRVRTMSVERDAVKRLLQWGFDPGYREHDVRFYMTDRQKLLTFLGAGLPELRRCGWRLKLDDAIEKIADAMPRISPTITIRDAPAGDFDVRYTFSCEDSDGNALTVSQAELQAAINRGDGYMRTAAGITLFDRGGIEMIRGVFSDCASTQNGAERGWFRVKGAYAPYVRSSLDRVDCELRTPHAKLWLKTATLKPNGRGAVIATVSLGRLESILRPYQKQGVNWMRFLENANLCGLLADEMGLGKTLQTLAWLSLPRSDLHARDERGRNLPALIVCPTSLVRNWEAEAQKFTPWLKTLVISGADRANSFGRMSRANIVITSYALLQRDFDDAYMGKKFSVVVLDEAQHIKNRQTKNAQAVKGLDSCHRLVLTGTPVENSVADVWSIFDFLMPDYLGDYETFRLNYEDPILDATGEDGTNRATETLARLKRKIAPFILRRRKKSVAKDLPDKIIKVSYCPMSDDAQREYLKALDQTRTKAGDLVRTKGFTKSKFELLALLMKLRQISARAKVDTFMEQLLQAIDGGHKVLVFSQFVKMLDILRKRLDKAGICYCYLDGSTKDRLEQCNRFNRTPEIPVFLISLMAGGTGLNLTGADMVMHYDPWWNPAVEDQATDRAHRIGQKKNVYVMKMIASGSIEEKVLALQRRKQAIINATVETTDSAIMDRLTVSDFQELLS